MLGFLCVRVVNQNNSPLSSGPRAPHMAWASALPQDFAEHYVPECALCATETSITTAGANADNTGLQVLRCLLSICATAWAQCYGTGLSVSGLPVP